MSKITKQRTISVPQNLQLFHQEMVEGIPVRCYAANWKIIVRVYLYPDNRAMQVVMPSSTFLKMSLREMIDRAIDEAKNAMPAAKELSPRAVI